MLPKTEELFNMHIHELKAFKIAGHTKPVPVIRVKDGWLYYVFEHVTFVPDIGNQTLEEGVEE
jgi:hypothetical protein